MKNSQNKLALGILALTAGIMFVCTLVLRAQEITTSAQNDTTSEAANSSSDLEVELQALEQTTPIPASQLPDAGTYPLDYCMGQFSSSALASEPTYFQNADSWQISGCYDLERNDQ